MKISIVTAFPELVRSYLGASVLGRGIASGKLDVGVIDIRDFADGDYRQIDDYSFGGGGMVLMAEPLARAVESVGEERCVVFPSPQGVALTQTLVEDLARRSESENLLIVCGHYEGADERFVRRFVDVEVSLGDFVITGGELPALAIVDAIARLAPGVVGRERSVVEDSFYSGMLDNAHYTRPAEWRGERAPEALTGGDHARIERYRRRQAALDTLSRRPDAVLRASLTNYLTHGVYAVIESAAEASSLLDAAKACRTYGLKKLAVVVPDAAERSAVKASLADLEAGEAESAKLVKVMPSVAKSLAWVRERERAKPFSIAVSSRSSNASRHWTSLKLEVLKRDEPTVFVFGEFADAEVRMYPIRGTSDYSGLSVSTAAGIVFDRFLGWR